MILAIGVLYESSWAYAYDGTKSAEISIPIDENDIFPSLVDVWNMEKQSNPDKRELNNIRLALARDIIARGGVCDEDDIDLDNGSVGYAYIRNDDRVIPYFDALGGAVKYEATPGNYVHYYPETLVEGIRLVKKYQAINGN